MHLDRIEALRCMQKGLEAVPDVMDHLHGHVKKWVESGQMKPHMAISMMVQVASRVLTGALAFSICAANPELDNDAVTLDMLKKVDEMTRNFLMEHGALIVSLSEPTIEGKVEEELRRQLGSPEGESTEG